MAETSATVHAAIFALARESVAAGAPGLNAAGHDAVAHSVALKLTHALQTGAIRPGVPLDEGAICRVTIVIKPGTTACQLTFAPGTRFEAATKAVERAVTVLQAEQDESVNCPAWRQDFVDGRPER